MSEHAHTTTAPIPGVAIAGLGSCEAGSPSPFKPGAPSLPGLFAAMALDLDWDEAPPMLDERAGWAPCRPELRSALKAARNLLYVAGSDLSRDGWERLPYLRMAHRLDRLLIRDASGRRA